MYNSHDLIYAFKAGLLNCRLLALWVPQGHGADLTAGYRGRPGPKHLLLPRLPLPSRATSLALCPVPQPGSAGRLLQAGRVGRPAAPRTRRSPPEPAQDPEAHAAPWATAFIFRAKTRLQRSALDQSKLRRKSPDAPVGPEPGSHGVTGRHSAPLTPRPPMGQASAPPGHLPRALTVCPLL